MMARAEPGCNRASITPFAPEEQKNMSGDLRPLVIIIEKRDDRPDCNFN